MEHRGEATCSINARHTNREPEVNRSPLVSVWSLNPALSGVETQSLRRVIRRCRIALTAINVGETLNTALLEMILPLAFQSPHILHGLLALSVRPSERSSVNLQHHQLALSELRADIEAARFGTTQMDQLHTLLASSFLMNLFTMSHCDGSWSQHIRGMFASPDSVSSSQSMSTWTSTNDLEKALTNWTIPKIPEELSHVQQLALTTAWETYRKSALLLLWRGCGFNSNLLEPVRADKAAEKDVLVTQIVNNVRTIDLAWGYVCTLLDGPPSSLGRGLR
ncbi:unnamed protein product [Fusarium equiseti]|uniref:Transcription factor n=1 Tax=Fusarium equiseti TaxID=61235 RepID=A0A8J2IY58_FUSEQ|nr:unnamed protein product [Fusarium equiseti]